MFRSSLLSLGLVLLCSLPTPAEDPRLQTLEGLQKLIVEVSDRIKPSVVHIEVLAHRGDQRHKGLGSGLILTPQGKIVTNFHVIDQADRITVILDDRSKFEARVLRRDRQTDLALLQVQAGHPLPAASLGDSDKVQVGTWVLAIGNPYGFDRTVSFGIVSGKGRYIPGADTDVPLLNDFLQTDALIDPGSSGGPLVNLRGEVLGINSVGIGRGQGFTIPSRVVKEVTTRAQVEGRLERGWLGVYLQPFSREMAGHLGVPEVRGILVSDVDRGSPAEQAGVQSGDILVSFNGQPVEAEQAEEINPFAQKVSDLTPGARVGLKVVRQKQPLDLSLVVATQPPVEGREVDSEFGALVKEITPALMLEERLDNRKGVVVSYLSRGGPADEAGVEVGDVIVGVENHPVQGVDDFLSLIKGHKSVLLTLRRGKLRRYALVDVSRYRNPASDKAPDKAPGPP